MPNELFGETADQQTTTQPEPKDQPSLFHVGEGKKYQSVDELDKAYGFANEHISKLEQELAELRQLAEKPDPKKEVLDELLAAARATQSREDHAEEGEPVDVEELVRTTLAKERAAEAAKSNQQKVREALVAKYGDKAGEVYASKGKELGIDLDSLTQQSAQAVLALFGADSVPRNDSVPRSSVDTSTFRPKQEDPDRQLYEAKKITREEYFRRQWRKAMQNN